MSKKLLLILAALLTFSILFTSCKDKGGDNFGSSSNGNVDTSEVKDLFYSSSDEIQVIFATEAEADVAVKISETLSAAMGKPIAVNDVSAPSAKREIVIGKCERQVSKDAYSLLKKKINSSESDSGFLVYSDGSSIALAYESRAELVFDSAAEYFTENYLSLSLESFNGASYFEVFKLSEYLEERDEKLVSERWATFEAAYGAELANAMKYLYSCYDDNIVDWLANLYDAEVGGFYFSNSARNYVGFLPDVESTVQALGFLANSGMTKSYNGSSSYTDVISDKMAEEIIGFVRGLQHENGYFYHPQWGREITDTKLSRRGRDLTWATNILKAFGVAPIYDTPNGMLGEGSAPASLVTAPLSSSRISAVSKVVATASDYVPEHLLNKENFERYLSGLKLTTQSYTVGNELSSQISQIIQRDKALIGEGYSLVEILIDWLNLNQNPETGTWDYLKPGDADYSVYRGMDGLFKILNIYNAVGAELPYAKEALESTKYCIDVDIDANIVCDIYNTWYNISLIFDNVTKYSADKAAGKAFVAEERAKLMLEAPELIRASSEKILKFMQADGGFDFDDGGSYESQGLPVNLPGVIESDVNSTVICTSGLVGHIYEALNISSSQTAPIFASADMQRFLDTVDELSPVVKRVPEYKIEYIDFELDELGKEPLDVKIKNSSSGTIKVVERKDGKALSIDSKRGGGDSVDIPVCQAIYNAKCYIFEADICIKSADRNGVLGELSMLDQNGNILYLLYVENDGGKIKLSDTSSVLEEKRVVLDFGEFSSLGSWFNLKVEYYMGDHDSFRSKIYLNDKLVAVSDNYYDRNGVKLEGEGKPRTGFYSTRFSVFSYIEAEFMIDNTASYHSTSVYEIPENTSSLRNNVDYVDLGEMKYDFNDGAVGNILTSENAFAENGVLNLSGESEIVIPVNIRETKANRVSFVADISLSRISNSGQMTLVFAQNAETKAALSAIGFTVRVEGGKTYIDVYDMPGGSLGSLLCSAEPDENGFVSLKIDYYDGMAATLVYVNDSLLSMTNSAYDDAKLKRCAAVLVKCNSGMKAALDNLIAEKTVSSYLDAVSPDKDEKIYGFDYSDPHIDTNGEIISGELILEEGEYIKLPVNRRGVASNMLLFEGEIKLVNQNAGSGYRISFLDENGNKVIEYVIIKVGTEAYIYESTENTSSLCGYIGSHTLNYAVNLKIEFYFREETANIYIGGVLAGISSAVYNSSLAMEEPAFVEIAAVGDSQTALDDVKFELNYKAYEKEAQTFVDTSDEEVIGFESATTGRLPQRLTSNLKSANASLKVKELYCKQKFTKVLEFATSSGANDTITFTSYGGNASDNCQKLSFEARIDATAPYDTFRFAIGSTSDYAYAFEISAAYGDILLTLSTVDISKVTSQVARHTISKEGEWFKLEIEYYYSGAAEGRMKIYVNDRFFAEHEGVFGTRRGLTNSDFGVVTVYSYSDTNAVISLDDLDFTTINKEYEAGEVVKADVVDFEGGMTGDIIEFGSYVKVNYPSLLTDNTKAAFADITVDPKDAANKVLRLNSTRKSGGDGVGYPAKSLSVDIAVTGAKNAGYCYVFEARLYVSSSSYNANGIVGYINLNFGGSEKATSIAIFLKTDAEGKKQAYLASVYGSDNKAALYTFECDEWISLKLEFYRAKYAADNYGTVIYANGAEVARDLAWRVGLSNYQTREFAAANLVVDRYMAGTIFIDDASVYTIDKTHD